MDGGLEIYAHMSSFEDAARQARWLTQLIKDETGVRREGKFWAVLAPIGTREELAGPPSSGAGQGFTDEDDERAMEIADFSSDQDDWYRSDSDGWFYED
jgi:hypothetical protein